MQGTVYFRSPSGEGYVLASRSEARVLESRHHDLPRLHPDEAIGLIKTLPREPRGRRAYWRVYNLLEGRPESRWTESNSPPGSWRVRDALGPGSRFAVYQLPGEAAVPGWFDQAPPLQPELKPGAASKPPEQRVPPKTRTIELFVVDEEGRPVPNVRFRIETPDWSRRTSTNAQGAIGPKTTPDGPSKATAPFLGGLTYARTLELLEVRGGDHRSSEEKSPLSILGSGLVVANVEEHTIAKSETWEDLVAASGLASKEALINYNFTDTGQGSFKRALRECVGCLYPHQEHG